MTNSWVGFLIWTASVSLAAKSKTSAVKIENVISNRNLIGVKER